MTLERRLGELRPSQLIHSFGVGAVVDLPHFSAMLMGLDDWRGHLPIIEERLLAAVQARLGPQVLQLSRPPAKEADGFLPSADTPGLPVATFPRYFRCPYCFLLAAIDRFSGFELKTTPGRPDRAQYVHRNCNKAKTPPNILPVRFVATCEGGHLDDFPWHEYVHRGASTCAGSMRLRDDGATGEAIDVFVSCDGCAARRSLSEAFDPGRTSPVGKCRGRRPHLRDWDPKGCTRDRKGILVGASNLWFPVSLSALHVPQPAANKLGVLVENDWPTLALVKNEATLEFLRESGKLPAFSNFALTDVLEAIQSRREGAASTPSKDLKVPEWEAFTRGGAPPKGPDFELEVVAVPEGYEKLIQRVIVAPRLREVTALLGFTRVNSARDLANIEEAEPVALSRSAPRFVPAAEVRGEGIFLHFKESLLTAWCEERKDTEERLHGAHKAWRRKRHIERPEEGFLGLRYVVLHSFAHVLMRQLALECGYSAASIKERIYAADGEDPNTPKMSGVLLYTSAPDSEGTLGGLVRLGRPDELGRHIRQALRHAELCSSDPLCAEHAYDTDGDTLHGAACHACLFAPETSCERGNKYLDRRLLIRTIRGNQGFFDGAKP